MKHYVIVRVDGDECYARNFLDGVLVVVYYGDGPVYVPNYRVKLKTGDMDYNILVKVRVV